MAIKYLLGTDKDAASLEMALSRLGFDIKVNSGQHSKSFKLYFLVNKIFEFFPR